MKGLLSRLFGLALVAVTLLGAVAAAVMVLARYQDGVLLLLAVAAAAAVLRIVWARTRW